MVKKRKRRITTRKKSSSKKSMKPIGIIKEGKTYKFAYGSLSNPRKGKKSFNKRKTIMSYAKKKGYIK